jgi:alcohol dehydrogenase
MDTAKGCNFLLTNGGEMKDYWGVGKATRPMLPLIAIPTTAGTGSEMQSAALIADAVTHQKMACLDPKAAARVAILDPALTVSQPPQVTACTGIDAIAHAVESMVTRKRNAISMMYAREAFRLGVAAFPAVLRTPTNLEARGQMLLAAALAGTAIENSMLGAAHAAANPLTAHYGVPHGEAVGLMLPHIVRFNVRDTTARKGYAELAAMVDTPRGRSGTDNESLVTSIEHLLNLAGMHHSIAELGVRASDVPMLAAEAMKQWTAQFNPRNVTEGNFVVLYEAALKPRLTGL